MFNEIFKIWEFLASAHVAITIGATNLNMGDAFVDSKRGEILLINIKYN